MAISTGARVNTNISALNALNALSKVQSELGIHQMRLASGKKINSAADDASGYVISSKMDGRIRALTAANDNVGDATNLLSVAEGGYQTISDLLTQIKDKVTRFNNAGFGSSEQDALAAEIKQLASEIDDAQTQTKYNGKGLIDGTFSAGATLHASDTFKAGNSLVTSGAVVTSLDVTNAGTSTMTFSVSGNTVTLASAGKSQTLTVGAAVKGQQQTLDFSQMGVKVTLMGTKAAADTVVAADLANAATKTIKTTAGATSAWQVGESSSESFGVSFGLDVTSLGLLGVSGSSITKTDITNTFTTNLDSAITSVLGQLGTIGAEQNRLTAKSDMLTTSITNTQAAKSRIMDADIAAEQIQAVKLQILQQTATAQLSQANQSPQVFLSLFR